MVKAWSEVLKRSPRAWGATVPTGRMWVVDEIERWAVAGSWWLNGQARVMAIRGH